ncbi:hypothetical protein CEXT_582371 [Caerostris extrusa]|uniref:Sulfotransferase domain-containing protein n=1 Tax=Caerostris extrusa TaxID=172846 RepID=A0AAV4UAU2_CAEEX|nr:hypothetical protein CEXT_582371 [Caerostris extrusa]
MKHYDDQVQNGARPSISRSALVSTKHIEETLDYVPGDGDIIIASYPKTGTTWLSYIVLQIISRGKNFPSFSECHLKFVPLMEATGASAVDKMKCPRVYKHHCPYDIVKKNPNSKCLYIYRNPEDTLVSYYHFASNVEDTEIQFDEFFEGFLSGNMAHGHYLRHVLSFLAHRDDSNLLLISYEKLLANTKGEILRMAKFMGEEYLSSLLHDESLLNQIIECSSFDHMKKNLPVVNPRSQGNLNFFRKGKIGEGKKSMTLEQLNRLLNLVNKMFEETDLLKEWIPN